MSGTISLLEVPYDWRLPGTYFEVRATYGQTGVHDYPTRVLILGNKLAAGTAAPLVAYRITRDDQAVSLFGAGSMTQAMIEAYRANDRTSDLFAMALPDPSASPAKASGSITLSGAGAPGAVPVVHWIDGRRVAITAQPGNTNANLATALAAAINADPMMPVVASASGAVVTVECKWAGAPGNDLDLRVSDLADETLPPGVVSTIVAMSGGVGVPDLAAAFVVLATEWYTDIVTPWTDTASLGVLTAELDTRYKAMGKMDAHAYAGLRGTFVQATTRGSALNSPFVSIVPAKASPSAPWRWGAALAAVSAHHLTLDPARHLRGLALAGVRPPSLRDRYTPQEANLLLADGMSVYSALSDGTVVLERVVTTRQRTNIGVEDPAWLDIMVPKTMSRIRHDWANHLALTYPRNKLAADNSIAAEHDPSVVTPRRLHGTWAARYRQYEMRGWTEGGSAVIEAARFVRNPTNKHRVDSQQPVRVIGSLMILAGALEFEA